MYNPDGRVVQKVSRLAAQLVFYTSFPKRPHPYSTPTDPGRQNTLDRQSALSKNPNWATPPRARACEVGISDWRPPDRLVSAFPAPHTLSTFVLLYLPRLPFRARALESGLKLSNTGLDSNTKP